MPRRNTLAPRRPRTECKVGANRPQQPGVVTTAGDSNVVVGVRILSLEATTSHEPSTPASKDDGVRCFYKNLVSFRRLVAILLGGLVLGVAGLIVAGRRIWPSAELAMQPYDEGAGGGNGHAVPEDFLVVDGKEGNHHRRNKNEKKSSKTFVARKRPRRTSKRKTSGTKNRSSSRSCLLYTSPSPRDRG